MLGNKYFLISLTWLASLAVSLFLRFWGFQHPNSFAIRPYIVLGMLLGPSLILFVYLALIARQNSDLI